MGRGGFGLLAGLEILILVSLQLRYEFPSAQEEDNALARFVLPMKCEDPPEVMMLHVEEVQLLFLAHPDGGCAYTDVQLIH